MYCYITIENAIGDIFNTKPTDDMFHPDFISRIVELPEGTPLNSVYDWETKTFVPSVPIPVPPAPMTAEEAMLDKLTELEYRQDLMELGLTEGGI